MKWLGTAWAVIWNIIVILIVIGILDSYYYEQGSTTAIAFMVLIYASIQTGYAMQMRTMARFITLLQMQNAKILRGIGNSAEAEILEEDGENALAALKKTEVKFWINMSGAGILWIIAAFNLLGGM